MTPPLPVFQDMRVGGKIYLAVVIFFATTGGTGGQGPSIAEFVRMVHADDAIVDESIATHRSVKHGDNEDAVRAFEKAARDTVAFRQPPPAGITVPTGPARAQRDDRGAPHR